MFTGTAIMSPMKFEDELRQALARAEQQRQYREMEEEKQRREAARLERIEAEKLVREAMSISAKKIVPYFEAVNKVVARGKGKLTVPYLYGRDNSKAFLSTALMWGEVANDRTRLGNSIRFDIDPVNHKISWNNTNLNVDEPDFDFQMKELMIKIVSDPANYQYSGIIVHPK